MASNGVTAGSKPNKVLLLHGAQDLRLETRPISPPQPDEVQIAVKCTGICGSDLHYYSDGRNGDFKVRAPLCLGHESSGLVVSVGSEVKNLKVNDKVAMEVGLACKKCALCCAGRYNICPDMLFKSSAKVFPHLDGTLAEFMNHPAELCHKLPENLTWEQGAIIEPLAVSVHAVRRSDAPLGANALVFGAGAIGLLTAAVLQAQGMSKVVVVDIDEKKLAIAKKLGFASSTFLNLIKPRPATPPSIEEILDGSKSLAKEICDSIGVSGFERVYECTGAPPCVQSGIYASLPGGKLVLVGMGTAVQTLPIAAAALREVDIVGVFRYANAYPIAIQLIASGKLPGVEKLITHRKTLEEAEGAFLLAKKGRDEEGLPVLKAVIVN